MKINAQLVVPGDHLATLHYAAEHFVNCCREAIQDHEAFYVALSGGSTPKALYTLLCSASYASEIEWNKVHLFWSDERAVSPTSGENNFHMAMTAGLEKMIIPKHQIHRMIAEKEIEKHATLYEKTLRKILGERSLDLVMLGMGEDGHTASLFPHTEALKAKGKLVVANYIPQKTC
jgi:6-phosphogluconolactonase